MRSVAMSGPGNGFSQGLYTLVRRFSAKERRRRIVAQVLDPKSEPGETLGIEN